MQASSYKVSQAGFRTQINWHRGLTDCSEGREFLIAIVGCFGTQESGSLRESTRQGPLKGNADDKDGHRYFILQCFASGFGPLDAGIIKGLRQSRMSAGIKRGVKITSGSKIQPR